MCYGLTKFDPWFFVSLWVELLAHQFNRLSSNIFGFVISIIFCGHLLFNSCLLIDSLTFDYLLDNNGNTSQIQVCQGAYPLCKIHHILSEWTGCLLQVYLLGRIVQMWNRWTFRGSPITRHANSHRYEVKGQLNPNRHISNETSGRIWL